MATGMLRGRYRRNIVSDFNGKAGIGTSTPDSLLHVSGSSENLLHIHRDSSNDALLHFTNTGTGTTLGVPGASANGCMVGLDSSERMVLWNARASSLLIGTSDLQRLKVAADGELSGDPLCDQFSYQCAGDILRLTTHAGTKLLLTWTTPATTETDLSPDSNDATYQGTMTTADQVTKGLVWALDLDGTDDYLTIADDADLSFDDSSDEGFTMGGWVQVVAGATIQTIMSKWDLTSGSELREWELVIDAAEKVQMLMYDESANVGCNTLTDAALSAGWHLITVVYDGDGGATAAAGLTVYVDGVAVAITETEDASYVAMEDLATEVWIGARQSTGGAAENFFKGDLGQLFITTVELTAAQNYQLWLETRGYYNA